MEIVVLQRILTSVSIPLIFIITATLIGCTNDGLTSPITPTPTPRAGPGSESATVTWTANRDTGVNSTGGGYRVYYANASGVATAGNTQVVDVPYVSGPTAPTTATISNLGAGDWYIKVVAYSSYNPHAVAGGAKSSDSAEFKITIQ